jgi:hypothetical protein
MQSSESDYVLLRDGRFERQNGADELRSVFRQASRIPQKDKLLIHFHGGLVVFGAAVKEGCRETPSRLTLLASPLRNRAS